jgi:hypothetical protein
MTGILAIHRTAVPRDNLEIVQRGTLVALIG